MTIVSLFCHADAFRANLVALIQAQLGNTATVELQTTGGRKLLTASLDPSSHLYNLSRNGKIST